MIIVTGSGRSGTSAVARVLHESGLPVGHDLIEADENNAEGYFEERAVVTFNDAILNDVGLNSWFATATRAQIIDAARARGDDMRAIVDTATPAWKDPRFSWTLEAWMEALPEAPRVIVCLRSPAEVVASTLKYYGQDSEESRRAVEHVWFAEYERLLEIIEEFALDAVSIEFGDLHADPAGALAPIERFLGRPLDAQYVRRDLRHHERAVAPELGAMYARVRALGDAWRAPARRSR